VTRPRRASRLPVLGVRLGSARRGLGCGCCGCWLSWPSSRLSG
jgi:hypothetical protein